MRNPLISKKLVYTVIGVAVLAGGGVYGVKSLREHGDLPDATVNSRLPVPVGGTSNALSLLDPAGRALALAKLGRPPRPPEKRTKESMKDYEASLRDYRRRQAEAEGRWPAFEREEKARMADDARREARKEELRKEHAVRQAQREKDQALVLKGQKRPPDLNRFPDLAIRHPAPAQP